MYAIWVAHTSASKVGTEYPPLKSQKRAGKPSYEHNTLGSIEKKPPSRSCRHKPSLPSQAARLWHQESSFSIERCTRQKAIETSSELTAFSTKGPRSPSQTFQQKPSSPPSSSSQRLTSFAS